jgi:hypothetical protein
MHDIYSMMPQRWHEIHISHRTNVYVCMYVYMYMVCNCFVKVRNRCLPVNVIDCRSLVEVTQLLILYLEVYCFHSSNRNWFPQSSLLKKKAHLIN